jgi:hypothetical protein
MATRLIIELSSTEQEVGSKSAACHFPVQRGSALSAGFVANHNLDDVKA